MVRASMEVDRNKEEDRTRCSYFAACNSRLVMKLQSMKIQSSKLDMRPETSNQVKSFHHYPEQKLEVAGCPVAMEPNFSPLDFPFYCA